MCVYNFLTFEYTVQHIDRIRQINQTTNMMMVVPNFPDCNEGFSGWQIAKYLILSIIDDIDFS